MAKTYNGHKNWAYWNVALWIGNDEGLYRMALRWISRSRTRDIAAERIVAELLEMRVEKTPDGAHYSKSAVRAAITGL